MVSDKERPAWTSTVVVAALLILLATFAQGQDSNWDLRNYHLYTPWAVMDGRLEGDIAAAQLQTWHNPTLDFPFAAMVRAGLPGWLISLWLALPAFIALAFALNLMDRLWPERNSRFRTIMAGLVAVMGAAMLPSIGTTFNDAFVGAGVLAALWWAVDADGRRGPWATWLPVGLLAGVAAGLKLTGAIYCVGFIAAALVAGPLRSLPWRILALAAGGTAGAIATAGPWALHLWAEHGNPLFPYFNQWFQSADALPIAHNDDRFRPRGLDAVLVPFQLLVDSRRFSESKLADPRLLLGLVALAIWTLRDRAASEAADGRSGNARRMIVAFVLASYATWVYVYGIYRYLFALELLLSVIVVAVLTEKIHTRFYKPILVGALLILVAVSNRPGWGRQSFSTPMVDVEFPQLPPDSMVLLAEDAPLAHAVVFLPRAVPALSIANNFMSPERCTGLQAEAERRIAHHRGPLFLLREAKPDASLAGAYNAYGLVLSDACLPVQDSLMKVELCPLTRNPVAEAICPGTAPDR